MSKKASTPKSSSTASAGNPIDVRTMVMATIAPEGTLAAPSMVTIVKIKIEIASGQDQTR